MAGHQHVGEVTRVFDARLTVLGCPIRTRWRGRVRLHSGLELGAFTLRACPMGFDFDPRFFACEPVAVTAPWPVFRFVDQATRDRIAVDIAKLLDQFGLRDDVEIVITALPQLRPIRFEPL